MHHLAAALRWESLHCSPNPLAGFNGWALGKEEVREEGDKMGRRKRKREGGRGKKRRMRGKGEGEK